MASPSGAHSPLTREAILGAAIRLFQQRGFSGLGMRQIAECLRIKAPSLYHHFSSKEVLAQQAFEQYRKNQAIRLRAIEDQGDLAGTLKAYAELFAEMLGDGHRPCLYLVMVREPAFQDPRGAAELKQFMAQNTQWLEGILLRAGRKLRPGAGMSEQELAEMIFATLEGMMALSLADPAPETSFRRRSDGFISFVIAAFA